MKNDIYKNNLKKLSSVTLLQIPRYTYVPNMGILSQTMPREWSYIDHLSRNLYIFVERWSFCEELFWELCQNTCLSFLLATSIHKKFHAKGFHFLSIFPHSFTFLKKRSKCPPCLFVERGHIFQNYRRFCDIVTTCVY